VSGGTVSWRALERDARATLEAGLGGDRRQEARWILERVSGLRGGELERSLDEPVGARSVAFLDGIVGRRAAGEPLQYALGVWAFRALELVVDRRVLIPRPETELVAQVVIDHLRAEGRDERGRRPVEVVDLGTGSGAIGLAVATEVPWSVVTLVDRSADALAVATANVAGIGRAGARVRVVRSDWYSALPEELRGAVSVIVANPPYVASADDLADDVRAWEPHEALLAGREGLADVAAIVGGAGAWLEPGGLLVVEHGDAQGPAARELASVAGLAEVRTMVDLAGRDRALVARSPGDR
jgi:release factor glutamine methyltransferase